MSSFNKTSQRISSNYWITILFFLSFSCKQKDDKQEELRYLVMVTSQTKDIPNFINDFNRELITAKTATIANSKNDSKKETVEALKKDLAALTKTLDSHIAVLENIAEIRGNFRLKSCAQQYLTDVRSFMSSHIPPMIDALGNQPIHAFSKEDYRLFKDGKDKLAKEAVTYSHMQILFTQVHQLDKAELEKYGLWLDIHAQKNRP